MASFIPDGMAVVKDVVYAIARATIAEESFIVCEVGLKVLDGLWSIRIIVRTAGLLKVPRERKSVGYIGIKA